VRRRYRFFQAACPHGAGWHGYRTGMRIGYFLSSEEFGPAELVDQARRAQEAGFEALWISDHFHPWNDQQGQSPFVWSTIGALSQVCGLPVTTSVTCPTMRLHPSIVAQAAATSAVLLQGRFALGVGSGEALNEHIHGGTWPPVGVRHEMLEEAVEVIRKLWTGRTVSHRGRHYTVDSARIYTLPDEPPPIYVSGFGPKAIDLAARIGDGFMCNKPDAELVRRFREHGGGDKPAAAGVKACYAETEDEGVRIAHKTWPNDSLPGELAQVLPLPTHIEQASTLVPEQATRELFPAGPDPRPHLETVEKYRRAGYDELYIANIGPYWPGFFDLYAKEVLPVARG
jgi:G6PDH family F420-dependent oxidoreductase